MPVSSILTGLLSGSVVAGKAALADLSGNNAITQAITSGLTESGRNDNGTSQTPKAYISYMFFDEQFNVVKTGYSRVGNANAIKDHFSELQNIPVTKNGYLYVYVSNESPVAVFFDNLQVVHTRGQILEENHYYPFGLAMAGISSKASEFGGAENKYKYNKGSELQNKEFSDGSGLDWYETPLRSLDPQLGRWWQIDSKPDYAQSLYSAMNNNPILYDDPLGDTIVIRYTDSKGAGAEIEYRNGAVYSRGGDIVKLDNMQKYMTNVASDLTTLHNLGDKEVSSRLNTLESSKQTHFIELPATGNFNENSPTSSSNDKNGIPTGSTTKCDPENYKTAAGDIRKPIIGLSHELLGHGFDSNQGKTNYSKTPAGTSMFEVKAVNIENHVRAKIGSPKRVQYGGIPIPANLLDNTHKKK